MDGSGPADAMFPVTPGALAALLSDATGSVGHHEVGHGTGVLIAGQIRDSSRDASPSLEVIAEAWEQSGLGRLSWTDPGPGLLELRIDSSALPSEAPEFVRGLLEGLLGSFALEPVGVAISEKAELVDEPGMEVRFRCIVGAPELIDRLRPLLFSGRGVPELMEDAWY